MKFLVLILSIIFFASATKIDPALTSHFQKSNKADVLIYMKDSLDVNSIVFKGKNIKEYDVETRAQLIVDKLMEKADQTQSHIRQELINNKIDFDVMWNVNGIFARDVPKEFIFTLEQQDFDAIEQIALNKLVEVEDIEQKSIKYEEVAPEPENDVIESNIAWVKAPEVWKKGYQGETITVGVGDTGVAINHESLLHAYRGRNENGTYNHNYNWYDPVSRSKTPSDNNGHGTHCTGTVLGGGKTKRKIGVAPKAKFIHCLALSSIGAQVLCMQWWLAPTDLDAKNPQVSKRPYVVSHSYNNWNCAPSCSPQYKRATEALLLSGIAVVNSSGNRGPRCGSINPNARYAGQISVGALAQNSDNIASFSSKGPNPDNSTILKPNVAAPGQNIFSAAARNPTGYVQMSGTSMSTPNVAGGIALLWSAVPELKRDIETTKKILQESSKRQQSSECEPKGTPNGVFGYGTVNYLKAVEM